MERNFFEKIADYLQNFTFIDDYSIYTLDDLHHPILNQIYGIYWDVTFFLTTIFSVFMVYTIITKSTPEMGGYKWFLLHQISWSYAFDLYLSLWKPIILWPFIVGYSYGPLNKMNFFKFPWFQVLGLMFISVGMGFSMGISMVHRYFQASPLSWLYKAYNFLPIRIFYYIAIFDGLQCVLCAPLIFAIPDDANEAKQILIQQNAALKYFFDNEPTIFAYTSTLKWITNFSVPSIIFGLCGLIGLIAVLNVNFLRILRKNKAFLSEATYKMQLMLFKTLYVQMIFIVVLLLLPLLAFLIFAFLGYTWSSKFSIFAIMITSIHTMTDFITMIYFIRAYRIFFIETFKKVLRKFGFKFNEVVPLYFPSSTSGIAILD